MLYFKNTELAEIHHVTLRTVLNWIQAAKDGKLDLALHTHNGKTYVANTARNVATITRLVEERRKYRNLKAVKAVTPRSEFYDFYNEAQVFDVMSNLDIRREIPFQYAYFDGGAEYWENYAERLASEEVPNTLTSTVKQLRTNQDYIDDLLSRYQRVNVIDIGVGDGMPVKDLLQHLLDQGKLGRYVAIDISPDMLKIAERHVQKWFGSKVSFEGHEADINYDRFTELLAAETIGESANSTVNIILALGGTFANLRSPDGAFKIIHDSMNRNDLFVYNRKLDSEAARRYFDFGIDSKMPPLNKMMVDRLNIDESFYDVEMGFDEHQRQRYIRIRLKVALTIKFVFEKGERYVEFNKNDTILLWRAWHQNVQEVIQQLSHNDFDVLQTSLTEDQQYMLTISKVKRD